MTALNISKSTKKNTKKETRERSKRWYREHREAALEHQRKYYQEHKDEIHKRHNSYSKKYREKNKERIAEVSKRYRQSHPGLHIKYRREKPELYRERRLRNLYGISLEEYNLMFEKQKGVCEICGKPEVKRHKSTEQICKLVVDHDHKTGRVRALLCNQCNRLVGWLENAPEVIRNGLEYLKKYNQKQVI